MNKEFHEVANIFPMMQGDEFDALKSDIEANGLREPIWLHPDGRIIDGRNRYLACCELGIEPQYHTWNCSGSLVAFVVSLNLHRRHLTSSQKAVIALDIMPMLEVEAKERQGRRVDLEQDGSDLFGNIVQKIEQCDANANKANEQAATIVGTNRQYVADVKRLAQDAPEWVEKIRAGDATITEAKRAVKEDRREQRRQDNAEKVATVADPLEVGARFATILIDPPWDWGDEGDVNQMGRAKPDYSTMTLNELLDLPVGELADVDCHIYLWITNRSLPKGFDLLERWGFRYVTCLTWAKPHFGMGNYFRGQTEHILFGVKGSQALRRHDVGTVFHAERGPNGHSSKPPMIYELIESCSPGPYLEMFSRCERAGWSAWGESNVGS